jgi:hypothetical protein
LDRRILVVQGLLHLTHNRTTSNLFGAFFWSRIAVETSFFGGSITSKNLNNIQINNYTQ